ncbi:hypothetical protein C1H46_014696 [Malus baccata]|uniref:Uncharacterized protein n=1 Tax=Malus baccata TaxID=106549 RepID=A0A540MN94_MALBA|nr:hypothetical protein C1H46_014696 [Malus baccata]
MVTGLRFRVQEIRVESWNKSDASLRSTPLMSRCCILMFESGGEGFAESFDGKSPELQERKHHGCVIRSTNIIVWCLLFLLRNKVDENSVTNAQSMVVMKFKMGWLCIIAASLTGSEGGSGRKSYGCQHFSTGFEWSRCDTIQLANSFIRSCASRFCDMTMNWALGDWLRNSMGSVMESVKKTLGDVEELRPYLIQFLSLADADVLANMPPLERAHSLFMLSKATTILFALRLRCTLRPFTTLSHQASTQIISDEEDVELDLAEA